MKIVPAAAGVLLAAAALSGCSRAATTSPAPAAPTAAPAVRTVVIDIHFSRFSTPSLDVKPGQVVRFLVRNHDPIPHEFIVGDTTVQDYHERGTDAHHDSPGAVSVAAGSTAATTYTFLATTPTSQPMWFGCHLPGHWAYGMQGAITVA